MVEFNVYWYLYKKCVVILIWIIVRIIGRFWILRFLWYLWFLGCFGFEVLGINDIDYLVLFLVSIMYVNLNGF